MSANRDDRLACRFALSVMSDEYIAAILGALRSIDLSRVAADTNHMSTLYRGKLNHVVDTLRDCFVAVNDNRTHITLAATFYPDEGDAVHSGAGGEVASTIGTHEKSHFAVWAEASLYVLGVVDFGKPSRDFLALAQNLGLYRGASHGAVLLAGDVQAMFDFCNAALATLSKDCRDFRLHLSFSVNSPTQQ